MVWSLIGCGYVGQAFARARREAGDGANELRVTRRSAAGLAALAELDVLGYVYDLAGAAPPPRDLICDTAVCFAPPGADPAREMAAFARVDAGQLIYVSSTGVYGAGGGARVDEAWPIAPLSARGRARAAAEAALIAAAAAADLPLTILRVAGIYGEGRGLRDRIAAGTYRVIGDGRAHVSRIHVDDLVAAIAAVGRDSSEACGIYNLADDDPAPIGALADAIAAELGMPPPPRVPAAEVDPELAAMLTADRRISNAAFKARYPAWALRYPSARATAQAAPPA